MSLLSFVKEIMGAMNSVDKNIKTGFRFTQKEISEILSVSKKENLKYFNELSKISSLKYFDISYLLSQVELSDEKIKIIKEAQKIYNDEEFEANGQTQSDFIFRVAANLDYLTMDNINVFKELVKCKNELYDFKDALLNPVKYLVKKDSNMNFAFNRVCVYN